jgi:hypothetical protein
LEDVVKVKFEKAMWPYKHPRGRKNKDKKEVTMSLSKRTLAEIMKEGGTSTRHKTKNKKKDNPEQDEASDGSTSDKSLVKEMDKAFDKRLVSFEKFSSAMPGGSGSKRSKGKKSKKKKKKSSTTTAASFATGILGHSNLIVELPTGYRYPWSVAQHYLLARRLYNETLSHRHMQVNVADIVEQQVGPSA